MKILMTVATATMLVGLAIGYWLGARIDRPKPEQTRECRDDGPTENTTDTAPDEEALGENLGAAPAANEHRKTETSGAVSETRSSGSRSSERQGTWTPKPEHRKIMARQQYGALFQEMALTETQVDALLDVLTARAQRAGSESDGRATRWRSLDFGNLTPEERERNQKEIAAVIGDEKAAQFDNLKKTMPARSALSTMRDQLERVGQPLTDEQMQALTAKARAFETSTPPSPVEGASPQDTSDRNRRFVREQRQEFRAEAASILTPTQLQRLDEIDAMQQDIRSNTRTRRSTNQGTGGTGS